jgi:hypothetical protein
MFCPECKAEYRAGFIRCADCGLDLVEQLDTRRSAGSAAGASADSSAAEVLWSGTDMRVRAEIVTALEAANIPYHERGQEVGMLPGLAQSVSFILVQSHDHDAARKALESPGLRQTVLTGDADQDEDPEMAASVAASEHEPADEDTGDDSENDDADYDPENFHPDDATAEVWSGTDARAAKDVVMCLQEVGIGCTSTPGTGGTRVCVMPGSAARAKLIIQQIIDAGLS